MYFRHSALTEQRPLQTVQTRPFIPLFQFEYRTQIEIAH